MTDKEFLQALRRYVEEIEVSNDAEYGSVRTLEEIVGADEMPDI